MVAYFATFQWPNDRMFGFDGCNALVAESGRIYAGLLLVLPSRTWGDQ